MSLLRGLKVDEDIIQQHIISTEINPIKPVQIIDNRLDALRKGEEAASTVFYGTIDALVEYAKRFDSEQFTSQDYEDFNKIARSSIENDFKIDFDAVVAEARQGMIRLVDQLNIPDELKKILRISLDSVVIDSNSNVITMQPGEDDFFRKINLSPAVILAEANILSKSTRQELSPQMIRSLILQSTAHELGHVIDHTLGYQRGFHKSSASRNQIDSIEWRYPLDYETEDGEINDLKEIIIGERFAGFFAKELVAGLNGSSDFLNDAARVKLGFGYIKQLRVEDLIFTLYGALAKLEEDSMGSKILTHTMVDMIICNNSLAEIFSFTQEDIEHILSKELKQVIVDEK